MCRISLQTQTNNMDAMAPSKRLILTLAGVYIFSGMCQPLIMTQCKDAGLADPTAQLYMLWYNAGPALLIFALAGEKEASRPSVNMISKAAVIAIFDVGAQALNYTGASLAGPTIFSVVYSSVTVWTAVFSRIFLGRSMNPLQWISVLVVFGGLLITATNSIHLGPDVTHGTFLVFVGSAMHALTYIMSEAVMTKGTERLSVKQTAAIQGLVAFVGLGFWQLVYTWPRYDALIAGPMEAAGTTVYKAAAIFVVFALANLVHSITFYHTICHYPGGATSAGVMKGLQAVLVFVAAHVLYCGRTGGDEMCFSSTKFLSLVTVVGGVTLFGAATERQAGGGARKEGYTRIEGQDGLETV
jgi:drug/metabolite transporter (DMT)-like permease